MITAMPSEAKRVAAARPMPEAPPVTTAVWPGAKAGWVMAGSFGIVLQSPVRMTLNDFFVTALRIGFVRLLPRRAVRFK